MLARLLPRLRLRLRLRLPRHPHPHPHARVHFPTRFSSTSSTSTLPPKVREVYSALHHVVHPRTQQDVVYMGLIRQVRVLDDGVVSVSLALDEEYRAIKKLCRQHVHEHLPWATHVRVSMHSDSSSSSSSSSSPTSSSTPRTNGLDRVKAIVAVTSCKGGVGKSTVAVNLAYALAKHYRVGIFDADIHGPSLPTLISPLDTTLKQTDERLLVPFDYEGVKAMSYGFVRRPSSESSEPSLLPPTAGAPAVMRGPMASQVIQQLISDTDWGELDYLVVDFPPGTGDIQITLCQQLNITAAVSVSTPSRLSFVDVVKGIDMFDKVRVPTIAVVENMAYFECDGCSKRHEIFGKSSAQRMVDFYGIKNAHELPVMSQVATHTDSGDPLVLSHRDETKPMRDIFDSIASGVDEEVQHLLKDGQQRPSVTFQPSQQRMTIKVPGTPDRLLTVSPHALRAACRCASCMDEMTGKKLLRDSDIPADVKPLNIVPRGNYAVAIAWSDGHRSSIYPFEHIISIAQPADDA